MVRTPVAAPIETLPRSDQLADYPHPRESGNCIGHDQAEQTLLQDMSSGRMAHGWLFTGPKGIGKATLAYRFAKAVLAYGDNARSLDLPINDPTVTQVLANSHPNLLTLYRPWDEKTKKFKTVIPVDEIRRTTAFFGSKAGKNQWRVCIVDCADEMNISSANALLKILEEPPQRSIFILIANAPGRLLPTIRSRCRVLALRNLSDVDTARVVADLEPALSSEDCLTLSRLSEGSPGRALGLAAEGGLDQYRNLLKLLGNLPRLDTKLAHSLSDTLSSANADHSYRVFTQLLQDWLARTIREAASGMTFSEAITGETEVKQRLISAQPLDRWLGLWEKTGNILERTDAVNLDKKQVLLSIFSDLAKATNSGASMKR